MTSTFIDDTKELLAPDMAIVKMSNLENISSNTITMIALKAKAKAYRRRIAQSIIWAIEDGEHPKLAADAAGIDLDSIFDFCNRENVYISPHARDAIMRASLNKTPKPF